MKRPTRRTTVLAALGMAGSAGALGIALAGPALAEPAPAPSASTSAAPDPTASGAAAPDPKGDRAQRQDELAAALATELGIDKEKVAAALAKVQAERREKAPPKAAPADRLEALKTRLDAAVKEGKLTAEESAAILKAAEAGVLPGGGPHGGPGKGRPGR